jgi:hypothetical protein
MPPRRPGDDDPVALISPDLPRWRALDAVRGHTSRALRRVDVWILIVGIAGVVIAYLAWVKPH